MINFFLRLVVLIFVVEIVVGYLFHMNSIKKYTDFYSSSLARFINFNLENYQNKKLKKKYLTEINEKVENKDISKHQKCFNQNKNINTIVDFQENRIDRNIRLQTSYENFFNKENFDDNIIILLSGSSELYGSYHKTKIHKILQDNLNKYFKTDKIIVINSSNHGSFISDEINAIQTLIEKYPVNIVVSYSGANDVKYLSNFYLGRFNEDKFYSTNLNSWLWFAEPKNYCLDNLFYTKENYLMHMDDQALKLLKKNYQKFLAILKKNQLNYMIFMQPFKTDKSIENSHKNFEILKSFKLDDDNFTNMNEFQTFMNLDLKFVDETHTKSENKISDFIQNKIIEKYRAQIEKKI